MRAILILLATCLATMTHAGPNFSFPSIDGEEIQLQDLRGGPVLVVNTASRCAFTRQYDGLQELYDDYKDRGLTVIAVPSDDFRQELSSAEKVKEFCALNFDLTLPMTEITHVRGDNAHPFFQWLETEHGFAPKWNFTKVLLDADGNFVAEFGSMVRPTAGKLTRAIEAQLR